MSAEIWIFLGLLIAIMVVAYNTRKDEITASKMAFIIGFKTILMLGVFGIVIFVTSYTYTDITFLEYIGNVSMFDGLTTNDLKYAPYGYEFLPNFFGAILLVGIPLNFIFDKLIE